MTDWQNTTVEHKLYWLIFINQSESERIRE